jgi:hypothetical protein
MTQLSGEYVDTTETSIDENFFCDSELAISENIVDDISIIVNKLLFLKFAENTRH